MGCVAGAPATDMSACELGCCISTSSPIVALMTPVANRSGRSSTNAAILAVSGRPDGGGESVMTVDLYGPGGPSLGLSWPPLYTFCPQRRTLLYIDAGKPVRAQQYNRFDGLFQAPKPLSDICNFKFDTQKTRSYKRGSHGERGVPKRRAYLRRRVLRPKWHPSLPVGLDRLVVRSMHRWLGKGYAGGGERQHFVLSFSSSLVRMLGLRVGQVI